MKEKYCKNCGTKINPGVDFCPNCGAKVENDQTQVSEPTPSEPTRSRSSMPNPNKNGHGDKKKNIIIACIAVLAILAIGGGVYYWQSHQNKDAATSVTKKPGKIKVKKKVTKKSDGYTNEQWMLMGYLAYTSKNYDADNTAELVDEVLDDLGDGDLTVSQNSSNKYEFSNEHGSVDVTVNKNDVVVTGDGETKNSKAKLEKTFAKYADRLQTVADNNLGKK